MNREEVEAAVRLADSYPHLNSPMANAIHTLADAAKRKIDTDTLITEARDRFPMDPSTPLGEYANGWIDAIRYVRGEYEW